LIKPTDHRRLYRQFELIYIAADERDVIRLHELPQGDIYLYRTTISPARTRTLLNTSIRSRSAEQTALV
jgi:hypothetical protein